MTARIARLEGIAKRFGSVAALRGADLELFAGEVHGVLGENGAGKSTLLNVLAGMIRPDAGSVEVGGASLVLRGPKDAWDAGIGMVHQHFALVPALTVIENLALGVRTTAGGLRLPFDRLRDDVGELSRRTGLSVPLDARVEDLGVGSRQRVEILKALIRVPRLLVLDEPTAVLPPAEIGTLFGLLRDLASEGKAVVLVAHKLDEVLSVTDRVTVLRGGRTVLTAPRSEVDARALTRAMVGTDEADAVAVGSWRVQGELRDRPVGADPVASLDAVRLRGLRGEWSLDGVSMHVLRGEVVGIAGVEGNGQRELALVLSGRESPDEGRALIPADVGFVPQDRTRAGLVADFDLAENVALALHRDARYRSGPLLRWRSLRARTTELMTRFDVRAPGPGTRAANLSGGNQQRLVVARELAVASDLLVAENPTRGLDVASSSFVHGELRRIVDDRGGPGVVLISTDLDEVLALSHRVLVMVRGRLEEVPVGELSREGVGARMLAGARAGGPAHA